MSVRIEKKEGRNRRIYNVLTEQDLEERLGFNLYDLMKQAAFNEGYVNVTPSGLGKVVGETTETLTGLSITSVDVELITAVEQGLDYFIFNPITKNVYAVTPTSDLNVGVGTMQIEETKVTAPSRSPIIEQSAQSAADDRRFRERIIELNNNLTDLNDNVLPELDDRLVTLDGYIEDPSTIPDNYTFFEGIVTNEIWASTGTFFTVWADNVFTNNVMSDRITANHIDVDDLAANNGFIVNLMSQELVLASGTGTSPYIGGLIRANFDGDITASNLIGTTGTTGFAIDWGGTAVFNDVTVRGTIIVDGSASNVYTKDENSVTIRASSPPSIRSDGTAISEGDMWIDTANNNEPYVYDGTDPYNDNGWVRNYTIINGGYIETGTVTANKIDIDGEIDLSSGGIIQANYDGTINSGVLDYDNIGTTGWAIDATGQAVFHDVRVRRGELLMGTGDAVKIDDRGIAVLYSGSYASEHSIKFTEGFNVSAGDYNIPYLEMYSSDFLGTIRTGQNVNLSIDSDGTLLLAANSQGADIFINASNQIELNADTYYKGQELDARFGGAASSVAWGDVTGKPFSTLNSGYFDVSSGELRIDATQASEWDAGYNHSNVTSGNPHGISFNDLNGTMSASDLPSVAARTDINEDWGSDTVTAQDFILS